MSWTEAPLYILQPLEWSFLIYHRNSTTSCKIIIHILFQAICCCLVYLEAVWTFIDLCLYLFWKCKQSKNAGSTNAKNSRATSRDLWKVKMLQHKLSIKQKHLADITTHLPVLKFQAFLSQDKTLVLSAVEPAGTCSIFHSLHRQNISFKSISWQRP